MRRVKSSRKVKGKRPRSRLQLLLLLLLLLLVVVTLQTSRSSVTPALLLHLQGAAALARAMRGSQRRGQSQRVVGQQGSVSRMMQGGSRQVMGRGQSQGTQRGRLQRGRTVSRWMRRVQEGQMGWTSTHQQQQQQQQQMRQQVLRTPLLPLLLLPPCWVRQQRCRS
jgi:hypothetical protein